MCVSKRDKLKDFASHVKLKLEIRMVNNSDLFDFLPQMTEDERSVIFILTLTERSLVLVGFALTATWGSVMKFFLYYNVLKEKITERPINILILLDQVIEHVANLYLVAVSAAKVIVTVKRNSALNFKF